MVSCDNYSANCCHKSCHNKMQWAVSRMYNQLLSLTPEQCFPTGKALSLYFNFFVYQLEFSPLNVLRCINNQHPFQCNICKGQIPISLPKSHVGLWRYLSDAALAQGTKLEQVKLKVTSAKITIIQPKDFSRFWCILTLTTVQLWYYHNVDSILSLPPGSLPSLVRFSQHIRDSLNPEPGYTTYFLPCQLWSLNP